MRIRHGRGQEEHFERRTPRIIVDRSIYRGNEHAQRWITRCPVPEEFTEIVRQIVIVNASVQPISSISFNSIPISICGATRSVSLLSQIGAKLHQG